MVASNRVRTPPVPGLPWRACLLVLLAFVSCAWADETCLVCGGAIEGRAATVTYRGRAYPVHAAHCYGKWCEARDAGNLDTIVHRMEPRAALFQGDAQFLNPEFQAANPLRTFWLWAGVWILIAIVSGGIGAALAVPAHRSGLGAFALGFVLPIVGIALAARLTPRSGELPLRGSRIPRTHEQGACHMCSRHVHPSASQCPGCGAVLVPGVVSEVEKAKATAP